MKEFTFLGELSI